MTTILVVDDEPLIAMALQCALEDAGYHAITAANGKQGLDRLAEQPRPVLVLLDMMMPVMNGPAMMRAMAEHPDFRAIPVIVLSSLPREIIVAQAIGAVGILQKPYTAQDVLAEIARVMGAR